MRAPRWRIDRGSVCGLSTSASDAVVFAFLRFTGPLTRHGPPGARGGNPTLAVTRVTPDVAARADDFRARVQSVHRVAAYLETGSPADLLVVALDAAGGQPSGILVSGIGDIRELRIRVGMRVVARDGRISVVDAGLVLDVADAPVWSATIAAVPTVPIETLHARLVAARATTRRAAIGGGVAAPLAGDGAADDAFVRAALPHVAAIRRALD